jgi:hypothetical protein
MSADMRVFLGGVLTGAHASRQRHLHQARIIQATIHAHWGLDNPWTWRVKYLRWFLQRYTVSLSAASRYRYWLTVRLIARRRQREHDWGVHLRGPWRWPSPPPVFAHVE